MSTLEAAPETVERVTLVRMFDAQLAPGDGRTIDLRVVPYNTVARVADPPDFRPYDEMWMPGAFERQVSAASRVEVFLNFEHQQGLQGIIGHGAELRDTPDGLEGTFRVHDNPDGEKALHLVNEGLLRGVSLEANPLRSRRKDGVTQRIRAHLDRVSLVRTGRPAYEDAQVLAVREAPPEPVVVEPWVRNTELDDRLAAFKVEPLARIATTSQPWDASESRFTAEQYEAACLLGRMLPVLEPNGTLNTNALAAAATALVRGGVSKVPQAEKAAAARRLVRYYTAAEMTPPPALLTLGRS